MKTFLTGYNSFHNKKSAMGSLHKGEITIPFDGRFYNVNEKLFRSSDIPEVEEAVHQYDNPPKAPVLGK